MDMNQMMLKSKTRREKAVLVHDWEWVDGRRSRIERGSGETVGGSPRRKRKIMTVQIHHELLPLHESLEACKTGEELSEMNRIIR